MYKKIHIRNSWYDEKHKYLKMKHEKALKKYGNAKIVKHLLVVKNVFVKNK